MKQLGTILLVDDDRHLLASMADWLRELGYQVDTANSYATAVAALDRRSYDLVLADIRLGDGDGFDVLAHARTNPEAPRCGNHVRKAARFCNQCGSAM